ncbi:MAG: polyprenyl synthetase family protein [Bacteroidia bacterium]
MNAASALKQLVNERIEALAFDQKQPKNLYEPMAYILRLGGKRLRPVLTMLAYEAVSGRAPAEALDLGLGLEIFHNFTLIHDDIMDRAPVRRGQPTAHVKWNEDTAILAGDALYAFAIGLVVKDFPEKAAALSLAFSEVGLEVCEGQMEDMDLAAGIDVSMPRYVEMIRKKTAALLGGCMRMGAIAAGASDELIADLKNFGETLGIAFQLQDDLMDAYPPEGFGKQVGGDILENKQTWLILQAKSKASPAQLATIATWEARDDAPQEKVAAILAIFDELEIRAETERLIDEYFDKSRKLADKLDASVEMLGLRNFIAHLANRKL